MKMNKLAAGALALALGLGAVAPSLAAQNGTGTNLVESQYNEKLVEAQKYFEQRNEARKKSQAAKERYEAAKKAVEVLEKKYKDLPADEKETTPKTSKEIQDTISGPTGLKQKAQDAADAVAKAKKDLDDNKDDSKKAGFETALETAKDNLKKANAALEKANADLAEAIKKEKEALPELDKNKLAPKAQALVDLMKAQEELSNAYAAYGVALDNERAITKKFDDEYTLLSGFAKDANAIVAIENDKVVVKPAKPAAKKDNLAELKRAKSEAETAIKAVKLLKELSPEKIKKVEAKLNALVAKNEALVKKADAKIAELEKVAFIATAYADEAKEDDTDALIKELDSTTSEIKDLIKDTPEDKKANEEKPEEKPADKKEEKTPSKKAGNNAKTGIAGVAGVAGILAAASVAYAASKRD